MVTAPGQWHAPDDELHASRPGDGQLHGIAGSWEQHIGDRNGQGGVHGTGHGRAGRDDWTRRRAGPARTARLNANDASSRQEVPALAFKTKPEPRSARRAEPGTTDGVGRSGHRPRTQPPLDLASSTAVLEAATFPATEPDQSSRRRRRRSRAPSTRSPSSRNGRPLHNLDANNTSHKKRRTLPAEGHKDAELPVSSRSGSGSVGSRGSGPQSRCKSGAGASARDGIDVRAARPVRTDDGRPEPTHNVRTRPLLRPRRLTPPLDPPFSLPPGAGGRSVLVAEDLVGVSTGKELAGWTQPLVDALLLWFQSKGSNRASPEYATAVLSSFWSDVFCCRRPCSRSFSTHDVDTSGRTMDAARALFAAGG